MKQKDMKYSKHNNIYKILWYLKMKQIIIFFKLNLENFNFS